MGFHWERFRLVRPGKSAIKGGQFLCDTELVMGSRTPFATEMVVTETSMETGELYLIGRGMPKGLQLLPLVQLLESPPGVRQACYFYKRNDRDGIKMSSYHHVDQPEIQMASGEVESVLNWLTGAGPRITSES